MARDRYPGSTQDPAIERRFKALAQKIDNLERLVRRLSAEGSRTTTVARVETGQVQENLTTHVAAPDPHPQYTRGPDEAGDEHIAIYDGVTGKLLKDAGRRIADLHHRHVQNTPSDEWIISHDLDKHPSVTVTDSAGSKVEGDVEYVDEATVIVRFTAAFSGEAHLN